MGGSGSNLVDDLMTIAPHTEVAHHIPGRIRLRILASGLDVVRRIDVGGAIGALPGIKSIRVNPLVGSVVIEYDTGKLPYGLWENIRKLRTEPQIAEQIREQLQSLSAGNCEGGTCTGKLPS